MLHQTILSRTHKLKHIACTHMAPPMGTKKDKFALQCAFTFETGINRV